VATNSRGDIFVYTRTGHPTLSMARPVRLRMGDRGCSSSIAPASSRARSARAVYGFLFAAQVRVDPQDNLWVVDEMSGMVIKFDPQGASRCCSVASRKRSTIRPAQAGRAVAAEGGAAVAVVRPARERSGRVQSSDRRRLGRAGQHLRGRRSRKRAHREVHEGRRLRQVVGAEGHGTGQFADVDSIVVDARGNVYAADAGNGRIQVFDNNGTYQREIANVGNRQAICITPVPTR
jgi:hypothetical protein